MDNMEMEVMIMATIDLKLKSYDELQFEIMRLITDNHLKQQQKALHTPIFDIYSSGIFISRQIHRKTQYPKMQWYSPSL